MAVPCGFCHSSFQNSHEKYTRIHFWKSWLKIRAHKPATSRIPLISDSITDCCGILLFQEINQYFVHRRRSLDEHAVSVKTAVCCYTSLLLGVFVVYVFDGPRATRTVISTVAGVSILASLAAAVPPCPSSVFV
jgi:hypothetical protein